MLLSDEIVRKNALLQDEGHYKSLKKSFVTDIVNSTAINGGYSVYHGSSKKEEKKGEGCPVIEFEIYDLHQRPGEPEQRDENQ